LFKVKRQDLNLLALQEDDVLEGPLPERSLKAGGTLNGRGNSKGLPISQSSGQLGSMKALGSSESDDIEVELLPAMTCTPLEINTTPHRYSVPESKDCDLVALLRVVNRASQQGFLTSLSHSNLIFQPDLPLTETWSTIVA